MEDLPKKKRAPRTTKKEIEIIANFLFENKTLLEIPNGDLDLQEKQKKMWISLTGMLNESGLGPQKTAQQWKSVVAELKTNIKKKARNILIIRKKTGGGESTKDLTDIEEKIYSAISAVSVEGSTEVEEIGISNNENVLEEDIEGNQEKSNEEQNEPIVTSHATPPLPIQQKRCCRKRKRETTSFGSISPVQRDLNQKIQNLSDSISGLAESINALASALLQRKNDILMI